MRSCGYVSSKKDGAERLNFTAFYEALLEAKGVSLGADGAGKGRGKGGRSLSYVATVQGNGNLLVGKAYTATLRSEVLGHRIWSKSLTTPQIFLIDQWTLRQST